MDQKQELLDFIRKQRLAVISTVGIDSKPESAVIEFGETNDFEVVFDTFVSSRKYKNLQSNKNVALVIGWDENITVQYEGAAEELNEKESKYKTSYFSKNPRARKWEHREGITFIKVQPTWIRYSDLNKDPWEIFEITF